MNLSIVGCMAKTLIRIELTSFIREEVKKYICRFHIVYGQAYRKITEPVQFTVFVWVTDPFLRLFIYWIFFF